MSERLHDQTENIYNHRPEHLKDRATTSENINHSANNENLKSDVESLRQTVEKESLKKHEIDIDKIESAEKPKSTSHQHITKHIKQLQFDHIMQNTRQSLKPSQKLFSRMIHSSKIEIISDFGEKTIARPSGIIGGSFFAGIGSIFILYIAHNIGFNTPMSLFFILFVGGFILGVVAENLLNFKVRNRK